VLFNPALPNESASPDAESATPNVDAAANKTDESDETEESDETDESDESDETEISAGKSSNANSTCSGAAITGRSEPSGAEPTPPFEWIPLRSMSCDFVSMGKPT
jgi:hypothetical protein